LIFNNAKNAVIHFSDFFDSLSRKRKFFAKMPEP
jgi:hypothetical protein